MRALTISHRFRETYFVPQFILYSLSLSLSLSLPPLSSLSLSFSLLVFCHSIENVDFQPTYTLWNTHERRIKILPRARLHTQNSANDRPGPSLITHSARMRSSFFPRFVKCCELFPLTCRIDRRQNRKIGVVYRKADDRYMRSLSNGKKKDFKKVNKKYTATTRLLGRKTSWRRCQRKTRRLRFPFPSPRCIVFRDN